MKILVLDNYDSFTYNLVHYIEMLTDVKVDVARNDSISLLQIEPYTHIVLSPGPGLPQHAGIMPELIQVFAPRKKILGVCLGMQGIGVAFGATLKNLPQVFHGLSMPVHVCDTAEFLFHDLPPVFMAGRYHSWVVEKENLPACLRITASDEHGNAMALRHVHYDVCGVQFHPESILTPEGKKILANWISG